MNENLECRADGCSDKALKKFVVMEGEKIIYEVHSCGLHDIKVYRQLSADYMSQEYKIKLKILEDGKWKNWRA